MKKITTYWLLAAAMTLAGCASDNNIASDYTGDGNDAVTINATRAAISTSATSTALAEGETFCLVNETRQNLGRTNKYKAVYEVTSSGIVPQETAEYVVWQTGKDNSGNEITKNTFRAVIPDSALLRNFQLPLDQSTADKLKAADWQLASDSPEVTAMQSKPTLSLNFEHQMSKLHFTITSTKDDAQNLTSQDFTVLTLITPYYNATANTVEAIIDPKWMISVETPLITIKTAGNETLSVPIPSEITGFEPGKQYNFNLTLGHYALSISSVSVTDWTAVDVSTGKEDELWTDAGGGIDYITFSAEERQEFMFVQLEGDPEDVSGFEYSVGNGEWKSIPDDGLNDAVPFGGELGTLRLRGINPKGTNGARTVQFAEEKLVECSGDIRTLIDYRHYKTVDTGSAKFSNLFLNCYYLTSAPKLPSTKLAEGCYSDMFYACKSLTNAPELPATTLSKECYLRMFNSCTLLTNAPELPATLLAESCYTAMFEGCSELETAPILPATTLASACYDYMFNGCSNLSSVTMLATDVNAGTCLYYWLNGAGTSATSRTLKLKNQSVYNEIINVPDDWNCLPAIWKQGAEGTTITYEENP